MTEKDQSRLQRLQEEHRHTLVLLNSPRLTAETRRVLEALRIDLERQIGDLQPPTKLPSDPRFDRAD